MRRRSGTTLKATYNVGGFFFGSRLQYISAQTQTIEGGQGTHLQSAAGHGTEITRRCRRCEGTNRTKRVSRPGHGGSTGPPRSEWGCGMIGRACDGGLLPTHGHIRCITARVARLGCRCRANEKGMRITVRHIRCHLRSREGDMNTGSPCFLLSTRPSVYYVVSEQRGF